jgi:NADH-quinone oxidoreductase subunit J
MLSISFLNQFNFFTDFFNQIFLVFLGILSVFFSFLIIGSKNPIHSIFALILAFVIVSIIMIGYLKCEFLSIVFLIVYVGAVSILFLFIIMLLNIKNIDLTDKFFNYFPVGVVVGILFFVELYLYIY